MTDEIGNLVLEHLKVFQAEQAKMARKMDEIITRLGNLEIAVASLHRDISHLNDLYATVSVRLDHMDKRIDRIERRLDLTEAP